MVIHVEGDAAAVHAQLAPVLTLKVRDSPALLTGGDVPVGESE